MTVTRVKIPLNDASGTPRFVAFDYDDVLDVYTEVVSGAGGSGLTGILSSDLGAVEPTGGSIDLTGEAPKGLVFLTSAVDETFSVDLPDTGGASFSLLIVHPHPAQVTVSVGGVPLSEQPSALSPAPTERVWLDVYAETGGAMGVRYAWPFSSDRVSIVASSYPTLNPTDDHQEDLNASMEAFAAATATGKANIVNTDGDPGITIYVGTIDPDVAYTPVTGDVWLDTTP